MICDSCMCDNSESARYCTNCGKPLFVMTFVDAVRDVVTDGGVTVLREPSRFLGGLLDLCGSDTTEILALERNCDAHLLDCFADAAEKGSIEELVTASDRAELLLRQERQIDATTAQHVAMGIAQGVSLAILDVNLPFDEAKHEDEPMQVSETPSLERTLMHDAPSDIELAIETPKRRSRAMIALPIALLLAFVFVFLFSNGTFTNGKPTEEGDSPALSNSTSTKSKDVSSDDSNAETSEQNAPSAKESNFKAEEKDSASNKKDVESAEKADVKTDAKSSTTSKKTKAEDAPSGAPLSDSKNISVAPGTYVLRSMIGNRVLEINEEHINEDGANAQIWQTLDLDRQFFRIEEDTAGYTIRSSASDKFLEVEGDDLMTAANAQQWEDTNGKDQRWVFQDAGNDWVYVHNLLGYYLDVEGSYESDSDGGNVHTWPFNGDDAQKWRLVRVSGIPMLRIEDGTYSIRSASEDKVLSISKGSHESGAKARLEKADGSSGQVFRVGKNPDIPANNIRLADFSEEDAFWLDASGADEEAAVKQLPGDGNQSQNWYFEEAGDGSYYIRNMYGYYLDASAVTDTKSVWCATFTGSKTQKWSLESV